MKFASYLLLATIAINDSQAIKLTAPNCDAADDACWAKKNLDLRFGPEG